MKILAVGGGSGGHVTPVAAVIEQLRAQDDALVVRFICDRAFETQSRGIMAKVSVPVVVSTITAGKFRRYAHLTFLQHLHHPSIVVRNLIDLFKVVIGFFQSLWIILWFQPDVVFAKGGYVCLPMGVAAWCLRKPLVIHDSDSRPGLTNKVLARYATRIATGFPLDNYAYPADKSTYTGVPIDDQFRPVGDKQQRAAKERLDVSTDKTFVLAFGGGLGSAVINDAMPALAHELGDDVVVYNIAGKKNLAHAQQRGRATPNYRVTGFVYGMYDVQAAADLVITRASATALQELAGLRKPVIAVPAKQLGDQIKNAQVFAAADAVVTARDDELDTPEFRASVKALLADRAKLEQLAAGIHSFATPDAATTLATIIMKAARR